MTTHPDALVDLRRIPPKDRDPLVFSKFAALASDTTLELVSDDELQPLRHLFEARMPGNFRWQAVDKGPDLWRALITRLSGHAVCCGCCGGV